MQLANESFAERAKVFLGKFPFVIQQTASGVQPTSSGVRQTSSGVRQTPSGVRQTPSGVRQTPSGVQPTPSGVRQTSSGVRQTPSGVRQTPSGVRQTPSGVCLSTISGRHPLILSLIINQTHEEAGRHASGRVGVPPAVLRVPRNTRRSSKGEQTSLGIRMYSAGREIRQAGRPPPPETRRPALCPVRDYRLDAISKEPRSKFTEKTCVKPIIPVRLIVRDDMS